MVNLDNSVGGKVKETRCVASPGLEDVGARIRQGDLAAADVQHLQHFQFEGVELMTMIGTMGKLRMVKAMTGMAMPRIRLLKTIYVQTLTALSIFSISCLRKRFSQSS